VETEEQFAMLDEFGCQQAQGYLFALPASAAAARWLMSERWGVRAAVPARKRRKRPAPPVPI
jgi:EAL domain-containing protein (putative c-di-GMP-specific phosphodiesterase class I)